MRRVLFVSWGVGVVCAGCADGPVEVFEDFYAASAARDVAGVRAVLCPDARTALAGVPDDVVRAGLAMSRVVKSVTVVRNDGARAELAVADATGQQETAVLEKHDGRWCMNLGAQPPPQSAGTP